MRSESSKIACSSSKINIASSKRVYVLFKDADFIFEDETQYREDSVLELLKIRKKNRE
jgi:hypothetical protein